MLEQQFTWNNCIHVHANCVIKQKQLLPCVYMLTYYYETSCIIYLCDYKRTPWYTMVPPYFPLLICIYWWSIACILKRSHRMPNHHQFSWLFPYCLLKRSLKLIFEEENMLATCKQPIPNVLNPHSWSSSVIWRKKHPMEKDCRSIKHIASSCAHIAP